MKIFSLQSKTNLAVWSLILGLLIYFVGSYLYFVRSLNDCTSTLNDSDCMQKLQTMLLPLGNNYYSLIFWILVVFIVLSLIKHFRNKKLSTNH